MATESKHKKSLNYSYQSDIGPQKQGDNQKGKKSTALRQTDIIGCLRFLEEQIEEEEGADGNFNLNTIGFRPRSMLEEEKNLEKKQLELLEKQKYNRESSSKNETVQKKEFKKLEENNSSRESSSENGKTQFQKSKEQAAVGHGISLEVLDEQDDEQVLSELYGLYEQFKHASQMAPSEYDINHEVIDNNKQDNADQNNLNQIQQSQQQAFSGEYFEQLNQQEQEQWFRQYKQQYDLVDTVFHEFLLRSEFYKQRKEERLQYIRGCQIVEENAKLKKYSLMSANSRKLMSKYADKTNKSVSERSAEMQSKKELEIQGLRRQQQEREMANCTFKPLINSSMKEKRKAQRREEDGEQSEVLSYNMGLLQEKLPRDKRYGQYQDDRQEDQGNTDENGQDIKKKQPLKASKQSHKLFTQLQLRTGKLDFINRMDCDSEQRAIKKILLENQYQPTFQPHIYQNIRSPAIIQQMQDSIMRFRMNKLQEIQEIDEILRKQQKQKQKQMGYDGQRITEKTKQMVKQNGEDKDKDQNKGINMKTDESNVSSSPQRKEQQQCNQMLEPIIEDAVKTQVKKLSNFDSENSDLKRKNKSNNGNNKKTIPGSSNAVLTETTKIQQNINNKPALEQQEQQQALLLQRQFSSQETTTSKNYNSQMSTKFQSIKSDVTTALLYPVDERVPPINQREKQDKIPKGGKKEKIINSNSLLKKDNTLEYKDQLNNPKDNEQFRSYLQANINLLKATLHSSS